MIRKFLVFMFFTVVFSGCFGLGGSPEEEGTLLPNAKVFNVAEFSIEYPRDFRVLTRKDFSSNVPQETKLVFQRNVKGEFIVNVSVGRVTLPEPISSLEYAKKILQEERNGLVDFTQVGSEDIQLFVSDVLDDTYLVTFDAKRSPEEKTRRFVQTYLVKDKDAYILTGAMRVNETVDIVDTVNGMLKSFRLK